MITSENSSTAGSKRANQRWARQHRKHERAQARNRDARALRTRERAMEFLSENREQIAHDLGSVDYETAHRDPVDLFPKRYRSGLRRAQARRQARVARGWAPSSPRTLRRPLRCQAQALGRREARPGRAGSGGSLRSRGGSGGCSGGGGGDGGGDPPGEPDSDDDSERLSDQEVLDAAAHVGDVWPDGLSVKAFTIAIWPWLAGMPADDAIDATERIYAALADRVRMAILADALTWPTPKTRSPVAKGEVPCRICGEPFSPLKYVDQDEICLDCWNFPAPLRRSLALLAVTPPVEDRPRGADLRRQLEIIVGDEPETSRLEVRWRNARGRMSRQFFGLREIDRTMSAIRNLCQTGDVFIGVAPRVRDSGTAKDVERVWCVWADLDSPEALQRVNQFKPAPTLIIETGSGGGHAYWQLKAPLSPQWAQRANRRLAKALGGDRASTDPARVLRPAGTLNYKHQPPRPVRCVRSEPDTYTAAEVVGRLSDDRDYKPAAVVNIARPVNGDAGRILDGLIRTVRDAAQGERNRCLYWSACRAGEHVRSGLLDEETACASLREAGLAAGLGELEVERTIRSGLEAVAA